MLHFYHYSRNEKYRTPLGARPVGASVRLSLLQKEEEGSSACWLPCQAGEVQRVYVAYAYGLEKFQFAKNLMFPKEKVEAKEVRYELDLQLPHERGLFFYWFEVETVEATYTLSKEHIYSDVLVHKLEGISVHTDASKDQLPYQITLYDQKYEEIQDLQGALAYQIFPDRFARDSQFSFAQMIQKKKGPEYIFHEDWTEEVDIQGTASTGYLACDFYGGSLKGIEEHLDYLEDLGIRLLYLNPIFLARSNHRYDTSDYYQVDTILGSQEDLASLIQKAKEKGISIILDGVFSHTGADSVYFNKFSRFKGVGAYQAALGEGNSPYYSWYDFYKDHDTGEQKYNAWWGFPDLPTINKSNLSFIDYICGKDGLLTYWQKQGIKGFRLDVSDELTDFFLRSLTKRVKENDPQAYIVGEVWEDPCNQVSYGHFRDFAFGHTHDAVMNYPLRDALISLYNTWINPQVFVERIASLLEQSPSHLLKHNLNFLSTHDVPRILTSLLGAKIPDSREAQLAYTPSKESVHLSKAKTLQAYLFLLFFPGIACVYYGDESGMRGFRDPFNRRTMQFSKCKGRYFEIFHRLLKLRQEQVLQRGDFSILGFNERYALFRRSYQGKDAFLLLHRGDKSLASPAELHDIQEEKITSTQEVEERKMDYMGERNLSFADLLSLHPRCWQYLQKHQIKKIPPYSTLYFDENLFFLLEDEYFLRLEE